MEQQLAACRTLVRTLPASLPSGAADQVVTVASSWLASGDVAAGSGGSSSGAAPALALQLQAEAAHLYLALFGVARVKLQSAACRQLLRQLCLVCHARCMPGQPPLGAAAAELACACMDLLGQLPHWYPQPTKAELAAAVAAVAAALEQQALGPAGGAAAAGPVEAPGTARLLCKQLKALQVLLAEVGPARRMEHG